MSSIGELARGYWRAEESRDIDAILSCFTGDAEWRGPGRALRGVDEIRRFYESWMAQFPQLTASVERVVEAGDVASVEWRAVCEDAAGATHATAGVNVIRAAGGKIASLVTYTDPTALARAPAPVAMRALADRFKGRRVLVTGAASGIGAATVRQFVAEGAWVTGVDQDGEGLARVRATLASNAERFSPLVTDVSDAAAYPTVLAAASGDAGVLDVLVNNAAVFLLSGIGATDADWRRTAEVNLIAPAQLVAAAADLLARGKGAVVNIASISGHVAQANRWTYNACKGGLLSLTRCQALDLAGRGVRVNSVSPGYIWTEVLYRGAGGDRARWDPIWGAHCPMDRCGEPFEVASAIAFLASDAASFITGADLLVDGGLVSMSPDGRSVYEFAS